MATIPSDHDAADDVPAPTLRDDGGCYVVAYTDADGVQQKNFHGSLEDACDDFRARTVEAVIRRFVPDDCLVAADMLDSAARFCSQSGRWSDAWRGAAAFLRRAAARRRDVEQCEHDWLKSGPNGVVRTCRKCGEETLL